MANILKRVSPMLTLPSIALSVALAGCTTQSHNMVESQTVASYGSQYVGEKAPIVVGNFQNRSTYMRGLFSSNVDQLGSQAKTILKAHLQQTGRFKVMDRDSQAQMQQEAQISGVQQVLTGARYSVTGDVTEFGRKVTGDKQFFGILGSGKEQTAYAKVTINVLDVVTGEIAYSTQAAGEYNLSNREVIGFGSSAGYDSTLNGKVLNFAITEAVNNMVSDISNGVWTPVTK